MGITLGFVAIKIKPPLSEQQVMEALFVDPLLLENMTDRESSYFLPYDKAVFVPNGETMLVLNFPLAVEAVLMVFDQNRPTKSRLGELKNDSLTCFIQENVGIYGYALWEKGVIREAMTNIAGPTESFAGQTQNESGRLPFRNYADMESYATQFLEMPLEQFLYEAKNCTLWGV